MTVTANDGRISYTGNGSTDEFAYDFLLLDEDHLEVYVDGVLQTLTTHYSVSDVGEAAGGTVTFVTAPATDLVVLLRRVVPLTQETDYQVAAKFPAETHEAALDKLTMIDQQFDEQLGRTLRLEVDSSYSDLTLPDPVSQKALRWKTDLSGLENFDTTDLQGAQGEPGANGGDLSVITAEGDMVQGDAAGVAEVLPIGAEGEVLTVASGKASWEPAAAPSPITTEGDLIVGDASGEEDRLPVGNEEEVLTVVSGVPAWAALPEASPGVQPTFYMAPESAAFPSTNFPQLKKATGTNWVTYSLGFDKDTDEAAYWKFKIPTTATFTAATIKIVSRQLAATTGTVAWQVTTLTRADGEAYDTAGNVDAVAAATVKGTAGMLLFQSQALTVTGWAAGEVLFVKLNRDVSADDVAEDAELVAAVIELS